MIELGHIRVTGLEIDRLVTRPGEAWCVLGQNGSGIALLADILAGDAEINEAGELQVPPDCGVVTFRAQQALYEQELENDDTDYLDSIDPGTPVRAFLSHPETQGELLALFALDGALDKGFRQLSSGQARKLALLIHLTRGCSALVLENPYDGLDQASCGELNRVLAGLRQQGTEILLLLTNLADLPPWATHLAVVHAGRIPLQGPVADTLPAAKTLVTQQPALFRVAVESLRRERRCDQDGTADPLVTLTGGFARYGDIEVFRDLDMVVDRGAHTLITGPNGCGKSTLLQMITGDHPLCYANNLQLFGRQRGSGESIWEIKRFLGIVSQDLHRNYRVAGSALAVVVSGLFDSIGLYAKPSSQQIQLARNWLARLGLAAQAGRAFRSLAYGEQRLLLIARALIKVPRLLILDEPTLGLDEANRHALLDFLSEVADEGLCTLLYASHRQDEYRSFFRQHIRFS